MSQKLVALIGWWLVLGAAEANIRPNILYCLVDDWSWPHAGVYRDPVVRTPSFDRVAREGMRFNFCFRAAPSCTPSRAAMPTGQYPHRLEQGSCLWGFLPKKFPVYPDVLEGAGYAVGCTRKGWGPGNYEAGGFARNPAGPQFESFAAFLKAVPAGKPFCFWFGSHDPTGRTSEAPAAGSVSSPAPSWAPFLARQRSLPAVTYWIITPEWNASTVKWGRCWNCSRRPAG